MEILPTRIWLTAVTLLTLGCTLAVEASGPQSVSIGDHTVELNGIKLWYKVSGTGPVCIMPSPNWGLSSDQYFRTLGSMEKIFTVVYLDTRGTGRSGRAPTFQEYSWDHLCGDLEALRVHLKQDKVWLMGHSGGVHSVLHYACKYPRGVGGLVLLDGFDFCNAKKWAEVEERVISLGKNPLYTAAAKAWPQEPERQDDFSEESLAEWIEKVFPIYWSDPKKIDQFREDFAAAMFSGDATRGSYESNTVEFDLREELKKVTAPAVIVNGADDVVVTVEDATSMHLALQNSKLLVIEKSGHFPWCEQPEIFEARVRAALQALGLRIE